MRFEFTPAAQRALAAAAGWSSCADRDELHPPEVLLGLLAEAECRAALLLAPHGIDAEAVRRRFPNLVAIGSPEMEQAEQFGPEFVTSLETAERLLIEYPRPLALATEHVLLGLAASPGEVSRWLSERGLEAQALEAEVHRLSGHQPGPLDIELDDAPAADVDGDLLGEAPSEELPSEPLQPEPDLGEPTPQDTLGALRVLDAAANRSGEGLRVVEDYLRFVLDDRHLTGVVKAIRHELAETLHVFPDAQRHAARETQRDVGTQLSTDGETRRADPRGVAQASFKRVEQALRSLEEFSKITAPEVAARLEQLRYRVYTLERAADITQQSVRRLATARLYVLVDGRATEGELAGLVESLIDAGVSVLQLRDKQLADRELLARAQLLRRLTRESATLFVMNDRPDLAVLADADGVHVGQDELAVKDARRILGPRGLIGVSTHSIEQARAAVLDGADYIGVGPTFPSGTKQFSQFTGPELLAAVQAEIRLPAFAIGGINSENLPRVLATGFRRAAVSGAVTAASDPADAARRLLALLG